MTKRDYFNMIKDAMSDNADVVAFCDHEIELLSKKAAKAKTAPKKVDTLVDDVFGVLTSEPQTIDAIAAALGISNAKATPRLNKLVPTARLLRALSRLKRLRELLTH